MARDALQTFIAHMRPIWGPLTSDLIAACRTHMATLAAAPASEAWLAELHASAPKTRELHRDPDHGFVLLAHTEPAGLFRPPHDHGRAWVIYAIQHGEVEMRTYGRVEDAEGVRLVQRDNVILRQGQAQAYLPGDIHDTRCLSDTALLYRFTERDLGVEDRVAHRLTRYVERGGVWTPPAP
jgi:hypothetical protein